MAKKTNTGGAVVKKNVAVAGGDFIGRDQIKIQIIDPGAPSVIEPPDLAQRRANLQRRCLNDC